MSLFIAIDGPNGVGKTTLIQKLYYHLHKLNVDICITSEPTQSELGNFVRKISEHVKAESLACLIAADRYEHITNEIQILLNAGKNVLCDRYFASSLVLQRMDGVNMDFILSLNSRILKPDIYFILNASPAVLSKRLQERKSLTRFENKTIYQELENRYYKDAIRILKDMGIYVCEINMENPIEDCIKIALHNIISLIK